MRGFTGRDATHLTFWASIHRLCKRGSSDAVGSLSLLERAETLDRIEIAPRCGGTPVVKGTRIPVAVILDQLAAGESWESLLEGYPGLPRDDRAVLLFAKAGVEHTEIIPAETG